MKFNFQRAGELTAMLLVWVGLLALFGTLSEHFFTLRTFQALANRIPALCVVATGMTLVLIIGGIDLSVGSVLGLCGAALGAAMVNWGWPFPGAVLVAMSVGLAAGFLNGVISVRLGVPAFIVTLGMLEIARGLSYLATGSQTKYLGPRVESWDVPIQVLGVSPAFLVALSVVVAIQLMLSYSVFGRLLVGIGTNEGAVRLAGINPQPYKVAVFCIVGLLTGLGGVFYTTRLGSADPNAGVGLELSAIAAAVIGGTSLMGGRGSVLNTFFGVLIIATLEAGLAQLGATEPKKRVITGLVIIIAVLIDAWRHRLSRRGWRRLFRWH